jgi:CRP-like cAMP-binding protein
MLDPNLLRTSRELFLSVIATGAGDLPTWAIDRLTSMLEEEEVEAGRTLFAEGEPVELVYFIREGRIQLSREGYPPWVYEGRWVIGPSDAILERPYQRTGVALSNLSLLKIPADDWLELLEDSFELARGVVTNSALRVAALEVRRWSRQKDPRGGAVSKVPLEPGSLSFVDRLAAFAELGLLRSAGVQVLADVVSLVEERAFAPGERIWARGELPGRTFLVVTGEAVATRINPPLSVRFGPGSGVAGVAALGEAVRDWEAHAVVETRTLSLPLEDWFDEMEEHFDLVRSALGGLALLRDEIIEDLARGTRELVLE